MSEQVTKKRKLSRSQPDDTLEALFDNAISESDCAQFSTAVQDNCDDERERISIPAMSRAAGQNVAPFLAKHIPGQYAPGRRLEGPNRDREPKDSNAKYCYRHRPDNKCRRQADDTSMGQLQQSLEKLSQEDQQAITHTWSIFSAAPAKQRNLILQGLLTQCCFPQLSFLSSSIRDLIRIDYLSTLPPEISFRILCFLDTKSLCNAAQVSHNWRVLADDDVVWHRMCEQHIDRKCTKCGWGLPLLEKNRLRATKRQIQLRATSRGLNQWSPNITPNPEQRPTILETALTGGEHARSTHTVAASEDSYFPPKTRPWKDVYKDRFKVGTNWKYGRCDIKIFKGHTNGVMCLQFDDQILATGSYDGTLKIWDIKTGKELRTLRGHRSVIRCLQFDDTKLISGSLDHKIKIWNWRTGECISTLAGHTGGVIGLHFNSSLLVSGSIDNTIRVWNFDDKSACVLRGHNDWVNSVKIDSASRTIFSSSDDNTVKIWDLDTKTCLKTLEGHVGQVQQLVLLPRDYEPEDEDDADDHDGTCSSVSAQSLPPSPTDQITEPFGPAFASITERPKPPQYVLTSALDSTIRLWDTYTGKSIRTYFGHVEGVWALAADSLRVVSGAQDRTVKVWDGKARCEHTFTGHAGPVTCIGLSDSRMCSGGEDCEVRMYSF